MRLNTLATAGIGKVKNDGFKKLLEGVWTVTSAKVAQLLQTTVNEIKKNSEDGTLTLEDARAALAVAVSEIWQALPPAQQKQLGDAAAKPEDKTLEQKAARARELIIAPQVEKAVGEQKTPSMVFALSTKTEAERIAAGARAAEARKALQERLIKARGLVPAL